MSLTMELRREVTYLAVLALLALQALPTASAQLSGNALYVYDHVSDSSNYYASIDLGNLGPGQSGWVNVSADVWLANYSGPGTVAMLRIAFKDLTGQFVEFACINGDVYARIVVGTTTYSYSLGSLATHRYYPLRIEVRVSGSAITAVYFYVAGSLVYSRSESLSISLPGDVYIVFGSPSEPNGGLQYDLYVDNVAVSGDIPKKIPYTVYNFDTSTPTLSGQGYTTTTPPGNPQPIPEPWTVGMIVLVASSVYLLIKKKRA